MRVRGERTEEKQGSLAKYLTTWSAHERQLLAASKMLCTVENEQVAHRSDGWTVEPAKTNQCMCMCMQQKAHASKRAHERKAVGGKYRLVL